MTEILTVGSICSGIEGIGLAIESFGFRLMWHAEIDDAPAKVHATHWPSLPNLGDIKVVDWSKVQSVDLITAGVPCQGFSAAGARRSEDDPRHLWPDVRNALEILRPTYFFLENVRGLLSAKGYADDSECSCPRRVAGGICPTCGADLDGAPEEPVRGGAFGTILADLARLGFDAEWGLLSSAAVGAPHRRERIFVLATDAGSP